MSGETPGDEAPKTTPTVLGRIVLGIAVLPAIAVVLVTVIVGIPIPFTDYVLHSVFAGVVAGAAVLAVVYAVLNLLLGLCGLRLEKPVEEA